MYIPNNDDCILIPTNNCDLIKYARFIKDICDRNYINLSVDNVIRMDKGKIHLIDVIKFYFNSPKTSRTLSFVVDEDSFIGRTPFDVVLDTRKRFENTQLINNNFDWSDYMFKTFTKKDFKNGDIIMLNNGLTGIVIVDIDTILFSNQLFAKFSELTDDFKLGNYINDRIVAVRRPLEPAHCRFFAFDGELGELIYECNDFEEMTLEEVCEALGKNVKIVKSHD